MTNEKALATGDALPPLEKGKLRLYSMRFCPYAERTRLVLAHKQIPHETININLKKKPEWFWDKNPLGMVPVLEQDSKVVYESAICDSYLDAAYDGSPLTPTDPYVRARQAILMDRFAKVITTYYKILRNNKDEDTEKDLKKGLAVYEDALTDKFCGGESPMMIDFHLWPWFERSEALGPDALKDFPKLQAWCESMLALPAVKTAGFSSKQHREFIASYVNGEPNYDLDL